MGQMIYLTFLGTPKTSFMVILGEITLVNTYGFNNLGFVSRQIHWHLMNL